MKIAIIGAAGVRTPLIVQAIIKWQDRLGLTQLSLMDIDSERLELIGALTTPIEQSPGRKFNITRTTDPKEALSAADFVITTFRVGGAESRIIDECVPLKYGILGQETTGPGGFAMGMRSIPVILDYVKLMQEVCPEAWLINFANPAGMLTEAVIRNSTWRRVVGICDAPTTMHLVISAVLGAIPDEVFIDYFGLNHLGWIKGIFHKDQDKLADIILTIKTLGIVPGLPFTPDLVASLGMIPNEYLYYYYYAFQAVEHIREAGESRGELIARQNLKLFRTLKDKFREHNFQGMQEAYQSYLEQRGSTYMVKETAKPHDYSSIAPAAIQSILDEGYAGVALNLIEALNDGKPRKQILNIPSQGAIQGFDHHDVMEIPTIVSHDHIQPLIVQDLPGQCLGLILQVKYYERLTIQAAVEGSYQKARLALTTHPLVRDYAIAGTILDEYLSQHQAYFPELR